MSRSTDETLKNRLLNTDRERNIRRSLTLAGALLKAGRYRPAQQYLHTIKEEHVSRGYAWDSALDTAVKDKKRSCERGLGGSRQTDALSLDEMRGKEA